MAQGPITRENTYTYIHTRPWGFPFPFPSPSIAVVQASKKASRQVSFVFHGWRTERTVGVCFQAVSRHVEGFGWVDGWKAGYIYLSIYLFSGLVSRMDAHFIFSFPSLPACYTTTTPGVTLGVIYLSGQAATRPAIWIGATGKWEMRN